MLIRGQPFFLKDTPHLPGCDGNIDMTYTCMGKGIDDRVGNGLRSTHCGGFTYTFGANRMVRRWCDGFIRLPVRCLHGGWDQVVLEIATQDVASLVIRELLVHGRGQSLRQTAVNLPLDDHRVDDR